MKLKQLQNIAYVIVNANSIVKRLIQMKNGIIKHVSINLKYYSKCKKDYCWNQSTCVYDYSKYLKSCVNTSVAECDEIIIVMDNLSTEKTKKTNTIATNVLSPASIICYKTKSKGLLYFTDSFISDHITVDNYYYYIPFTLTSD